MLVLSRKVGEKILIGTGANAISIIVVDVYQGKVKLGIEAPRDIPVFRSELLDEGGDTRNKPA